jgi:hypothetical protein
MVWFVWARRGRNRLKRRFPARAECVVSLLKTIQGAMSGEGELDEEYIECLCRLMRTVGKWLDRKEQVKKMDKYFKLMDKYSKDKRVSTRMRFGLQVGLGRIVALHHRSSTSYQIHEHIRFLYF